MVPSTFAQNIAEMHLLSVLTVFFELVLFDLFDEVLDLRCELPCHVARTGSKT